MKNVLMAFAIALSFAACNGKTDSTTNTVSYDTAGEYQRRLADSAATISATPQDDDTIVTSDGQVYIKAGTNTEAAPAVRENRVTERSTVTPRRSTSGNTSRGTARRSTSSRSGSSTGTSSTGTASDGVGSSTTGTTTAPQAEEKKGWSNAAKGAAIGGAAGAVTGAIISKKKGKGAVIGGVVGAAGGYILGRKKDKKATSDTAY